MAMMVAARRAIDWVRRNPAYGLIAVMAPVVAVIAGVPKAWDAVAQIFDIPKCFTYSDTYYYYNGHFKQIDTGWIEYQPSAKINFVEFQRDKEYIILVNRTPRVDPRSDSMLVRLPVCGGTAQWTYENPERWVDLYQITRNVSSNQRLAQASFER